MGVSIDISEIAGKLAALHERDTHHGERGHSTVAVVVPLAEGRAEVVREFLAEGPPFDPREIGLAGHKVFLTEHEAVFVFETEEGVHAFERILAEPELWAVVEAWERSLAGEPRLAATVYEWPEHRHLHEPANPPADTG